MSKIVKDQINKLKPSATLAINEKSNQLIRSGKKVYKFGFGQSPFPIPDSIISALKNAADKNTYLPMQGLKELRSAITNDRQSVKSREKFEELVHPPEVNTRNLLTDILTSIYCTCIVFSIYFPKLF